MSGMFNHAFGTRLSAMSASPKQAVYGFFEPALAGDSVFCWPPPSPFVYADLREAMSMEKRYFTSDLSSLS